MLSSMILRLMSATSSRVTKPLFRRLMFRFFFRVLALGFDLLLRAGFEEADALDEREVWRRSLGGDVERSRRIHG